MDMEELLEQDICVENEYWLELKVSVELVFVVIIDGDDFMN